MRDSLVFGLGVGLIVFAIQVTAALIAIAVGVSLGHDAPYGIGNPIIDFLTGNNDGLRTPAYAGLLAAALHWTVHIFRTRSF